MKRDAANAIPVQARATAFQRRFKISFFRPPVTDQIFPRNGMEKSEKRGVGICNLEYYMLLKRYWNIRTSHTAAIEREMEHLSAAEIVINFMPVHSDIFCSPLSSRFRHWLL
jgi:hypothetical protein